MTNQQIIDFIKSQLQNGINKETITKELLENGWTVQDVEEGFKATGVPIINPSDIPISPSLNNINLSTSSTQTKNHSGLKIFLIILALFLLAGGASAYYFRNSLVNLPIIGNLFIHKGVIEPQSSENNTEKSGIVQEESPTQINVAEETAQMPLDSVGDKEITSQTFINTTYNYQFNYPKPSNISGDSIIIPSLDSSDLSNVKLILKSKNMKDYTAFSIEVVFNIKTMEQLEALLQKKLKSSEITGLGKIITSNTTIDGYKAIKSTVDGKYVGVGLIKNDRAYILRSYIGNPTEPLFEELLSSFKFTKVSTGVSDSKYLQLKVEQNEDTKNLSGKQAGSIKVLSLTNGQKMISGSTISVKYEITSDNVKGTIIVGKCNEIISGKLKGIYSFDCKIQTKLGPINVGVIDFAKLEQPLDFTLEVVTPTDVKPIEIILPYQEDPVVAMVNNGQSYIAVSIKYSDGVTREIPFSYLEYLLDDPSIISFSLPKKIDDTYAQHFIANKAGGTVLHIKYQDVKKNLSILACSGSCPQWGS